MQLFSVNAVVENETKYPHLISKAKAADLLETYKLLESENYKLRLSALNELFDETSENAYMIILNHWSREKNQKNRDYSFKQMAQKK